MTTKTTRKPAARKTSQVINIDGTKVAEVTHLDVVHEHPAYEADNCPECGTAAVIPNVAEEAAEKKASKKVAAKKVANDTECVNGHPKDEFWTTTAGGRKYCKQCAREASAKSRAKNPRPTTRKVALDLSDEALDSIVKVANFKNTSAAVREELLAFVIANRNAAADS